jgi:hypothetical protein
MNVKEVKEVNQQHEHNIVTLRTHLFNCMDQLALGMITPDQAKAMAACSKAIVDSIKTEIEFRELTSRLDLLPEKLFL